jgi:hypothetical protein
VRERLKKLKREDKKRYGKTWPYNRHKNRDFGKYFYL